MLKGDLASESKRRWTKAHSEALTKERDDLKQRLQVAEAQVKSLTTTLTTSYGTTQGSQGSKDNYSQ